MNTRPAFSLATILVTAVFSCSLTLSAQTNGVPAIAQIAVTVTNVAATKIATAGATNDAAPTNASAPVAAVGKTDDTKRDVAPALEPKPASTSSRTDYASFRVVSEKNIFNGNRAAGSGVKFTSTRSGTSQASRPVEWFTLVGTLVSDRSMTAFFDGSGADFQVTLTAGEKVAGFTVKEVLHAGVCLLEGITRSRSPSAAA